MKCNSRTLTFTAENKTIYTKIQLLNTKFMVIDEIQGVFIDGSISTDSGSDIRNTFDATILVKMTAISRQRQPACGLISMCVYLLDF